MSTQTNEIKTASLRKPKEPSYMYHAEQTLSLTKAHSDNNIVTDGGRGEASCTITSSYFFTKYSTKQQLLTQL